MINDSHSPAADTRSLLSSARADDGIMEWLETAFVRFAERVAVECEETKLSYHEIDRRSGELANALKRAELLPGMIVVALARNRMEMIVVLLGILRAGCVFVPVDPTLPKNRLTNILADLRPDGYVIEPELEAFAFPDVKPLKQVKIEGNGFYTSFVSGKVQSRNAANGERIIGQSPANPDVMRYITYTSGSTGNPKGIAGRLGGISHFIRWEIETFGIEEGWRFSQLTSPTFDAYFRDIFVPLCSGGTICIPSSEASALEPETLVKWIDGAAITLIHCVPSVFSLLLEQRGPASRFEFLKWILMAGEVLRVVKVKQWMDLFGDRIKLVNLYGPSETTMVKFFHVVRREDVSNGFIPIGVPIKGAKALILDGEGKVCPPGILGEIHIRTPHRTLGYYRDQAATDRAFIQNPFTHTPGDLIYKTGDLGLILPDGNFRFCGRKDNQVKIRGVRVELEEIETSLLFHEAVSAAVVLFHEDEESSARMTGYVVLKKEARVSTDELRAYLEARLPEYMVPNAFAILASLPLTPNGKVDRKALPAMEKSAAKEFVAPRDKMEASLTEIFQEVLKLERVGIFENFFELGGHSLLAMQVVARVRSVFQIEMPLRSFFAAKTVAGLAEALQKAREQGATLKPQTEIRKADRIAPGWGEMNVDAISDEEVDALLRKLSAAAE